MVLRRQEAFLTAIKNALLKKGKSANLASYAYWLTLSPGKEEIGEGTGAYLPPIMAIEPPLTRAYLIEHQIPSDHLEIIEGFVPLWDTWAQSASQRLQEPPRDTSEPQQIEGEEGAALAATQETKPASDPTIIISSEVPERSMLAVYNAVWSAKQRGMRGGVVPDEEAWWDIFGKLEIAAFAQADIKPLNQIINDLIAAKTKTA
jgi:hypothetical protein